MKLRKIVVNITGFLIVKKPIGIKFGEKGEKPSVRANEAGKMEVETAGHLGIHQSCEYRIVIESAHEITRLIRRYHLDE